MASFTQKERQLRRGGRVWLPSLDFFPEFCEENKQKVKCMKARNELNMEESVAYEDTCIVGLSVLSPDLPLPCTSVLLTFFNTLILLGSQM